MKLNALLSIPHLEFLELFDKKVTKGPLKQAKTFTRKTRKLALDLQERRSPSGTQKFAS